MNIAITSCGREKDSQPDMSFGRAKWFIFYDEDTGRFEARENSDNVEAAHGAGIQAAQRVADFGADVVLTGNIGPNAFRTLKAAGIRIFLFGKDRKSVAEVLQGWKAGEFSEAAGATNKGHRA
ncbi:MAG: Dinitrogenase iron-molybdenum cofactor [Syntrophus sp. PtaU1.Bin005]|uniref:NifB/NifX family molybdenum-iron cluster-binding protein n=1 Tax=Syntrophus TaxID=43773 RepID=UPI0009CD7112|nr:MAG: Dinitrogenase iron-molybdenum cofactor [Syntrophus sp. PtaB.Bin138]OPY79951.1 MAG: Dinitrogenase iron-molybdenum cofactor [Syntrophus sp. PtaU1.Bin005]